jgi:acyl-homoserine lactone acylase PvdQ
MEKFAFRIDQDLDRPNFAYAKLIRKEVPDVESWKRYYYKYGYKGMEVRRTGYVFWDKTRLEGWGPDFKNIAKPEKELTMSIATRDGHERLERERLEHLSGYNSEERASAPERAFRPVSDRGF